MALKKNTIHLLFWSGVGSGGGGEGDDVKF